MTTISTSFGHGDVLLWMLEFFLFFIWFYLLVVIFGDIFRDHETSGFAKALWVILVIIVPFFGILLYLIVRGHGMAARQAAQVQRAQSQFDEQIRAAASTTASSADQIAQGKALLDSGAITPAEFEALKAKVLG